MKSESLKGLKEFSQELINLGMGIEEKLAKKQFLEEKIKQEEESARRLQNEIFTARSELAKIEVDLGRLEARRQEIEKKLSKK